MTKSVSYKTSGVDIEAANRFVGAIQGDMKRTQIKGVLKRKGSFGALFELASKQYKEPVLVSSTDGVGTKLLIAQAVGKHDTVGIDLVAMNVNDILCCGAKPLFFLDYIACGKVKVNVLKDIVKGITKGCELSGCSLIGGETAEMPGMYHPEEYDLAGFVVGVVEKRKLIDGSKIKVGDALIGFSSSGIHSNGYSLVRKVFNLNEQKRLAKELLTPTRIYAKEVDLLINRFDVKGIAHVTGGAFYEKMTKVLPDGLCFDVERGTWPVPLIFQNIQKRGRITDHEMFRTFNMGIGLAVVLSPKDLPAFRQLMKKNRIKFYEIGNVVKDNKQRIRI